MFHLLLHTVDPALGRLDYDSLSDQALMEMLITSVVAESKQYFKDENGNFLDVCEWRYTDDEDVFHGIYCKDDRVTQVDLSYSQFEKEQFPFHFIPPLVHFCDIANSRLHGTLDTTLLPLHLTFLILCQNLLHGAINWGGFPRALEEIELSYNEFCGSFLLQDLPDCIKFLDARNNKLSGELSLDSIPKGMENLWLGENELSGSIRLKHLPSPMPIKTCLTTLTGMSSYQQCQRVWNCLGLFGTS